MLLRLRKLLPHSRKLRRPKQHRKRRKLPRLLNLPRQKKHRKLLLRKKKQNQNPRRKLRRLLLRPRLSPRKRLRKQMPLNRPLLTKRPKNAIADFSWVRRPLATLRWITASLS